MIGKLLAATTLLAASSAAAQEFDEPRWYGALDVGAHWPGEIDSRSTGNAPDGRPYDWRWSFKSGAAVGARLGYRVTPHLRVEGQFQFQPTGVASVHAPGAEVGGASVVRPGEPWGLCAAPPVNGRCVPTGERSTGVPAIYTGMANVIYDVRPERRIDPFLGVGVGITHIEMLTTYWFSNTTGPVSPANPSPQSLKLAGTLTRSGEIAVQGLAGVSYRVAARLHLDLTWRYFATPGSVRWNPVNNTPGLPVGSGLRPGDFLGSFSGQSLTLGLRYAF